VFTSATLEGTQSGKDEQSDDDNVLGIDIGGVTCGEDYKGYEEEESVDAVPVAEVEEELQRVRV
jgi:hypothetical protein